MHITFFKIKIKKKTKKKLVINLYHNDDNNNNYNNNKLAVFYRNLLQIYPGHAHHF